MDYKKLRQAKAIEATNRKRLLKINPKLDDGSGIYFYSEENPFGWKINFIHYPVEQLDKMEQFWILEYTKKGYQCRYNKTSGSQGEGKEKINEFRPAKGYRDGLQQGKKTLARELKHIIDTHLNVSIRPEKANNKVSIKALEKFNDLLNEENYH